MNGLKLRIAYCLFLVFFSSRFLSAHNITPLVDDICDLLAQGHSIDKVVAMIGDRKKDPYDIQKLVTHIHALLDKQQKKDDVINIVVNIMADKKSDFYARRNLCVRKSYFVLAVIVLITYYLLFRHNKPKKTKKPKKIPQISQIPSEEKIEQQETPRPSQPGEKTYKCGRGNLEILFDQRLEAGLAEQIEYAKNIKLVPDMTKVGAIESKSEPRGNIRFNTAITQQIKHAQEIGLVPDMTKFVPLPPIALTTPH